MTPTATISPNEIPVAYCSRADVEREFLTVDCPNGWDDVMKLCKKVLVYDGRRFVFSGWNSDTNKCYFYRMFTGNPSTAIVVDQFDNG